MRYLLLLFLALAVPLNGQTIKTVSGVTWTTGVKTINGLTASTIKTVSGVNAPSSFSGLLDAVPNAGIAFGVRRLNSAYSGPLIRIKRLSDGTESDINASGEGLDEASINSFCSGTTCYVAKAYDQSGNGFDAIGKGYSATSDLPIIYESGAIVTLNGKPAFKITHPRTFQWTQTTADLSDFLTGGAAGTDKKTTGHMVGQQGTTTDPYKIILESNDGGSEILWFYQGTGAEQIEFDATAASSGTVFTDAAQKHWIWKVDGNTFSWHENGTQVASNSNSSIQSPTTTGVVFNIGGFGFSTRNMEGFIQEVVIWKTAETVSTIFNNADTYYSIP